MIYKFNLKHYNSNDKLGDQMTEIKFPKINFESKYQNYKQDELESYKLLRTNIEFSSIDSELQVLAVTSSDSAEAKTTTSVNLAKVMAAQKSRVLLIDCDLRIPDVHKVLKLSNRLGLTNALVNHETDITSLTKYIQSVKVQNGINDLFVMTSGSTIPNPLEVLSSKRFKELISTLKEHFNFIVIDAPPVLPVADAIPISLASDGVLFCIASHQTQKERAVTAVSQLQRANANIIGTVLTLVPSSKNNYYNYSYTKHSKVPRTLGHALKIKNRKLRSQEK